MNNIVLVPDTTQLAQPCEHLCQTKLGFPQLSVGKRYYLCPCWMPLNPPGSAFMPTTSTNVLENLRKVWGGRILTLDHISTSGLSGWFLGSPQLRNGLCISRRFLTSTVLRDQQWLVEAVGKPAEYNDKGDEIVPEGTRVVWLRANSYKEIEDYLNRVYPGCWTMCLQET